MIDDIIDNSEMDYDDNALGSSNLIEDDLSQSFIQQELIASQELYPFNFHPDNVNIDFDKHIDITQDIRYSHGDENSPSCDYLDVSNEIDVDNLLNIPHTDGLTLSRDEIDQLTERIEGVKRDTHGSDISFGKKGDPGECCTRHCCTGASYCDASYGDFHR